MINGNEITLRPRACHAKKHTFSKRTKSPVIVAPQFPCLRKWPGYFYKETR